MRDEAEQVRAVERERLRALAGTDMPVARAVHAADLQLVNPQGQMLSKDQYLGGIASGAIDYRRVAGIDAAGVVEAAGANVRRLRNGDEVLGFCRGAFAEYACAAAASAPPRARWISSGRSPSC
jgi:NADPH:quinone reductase-like Zn-dependent oxidoreductase